MVNTYKTHYLYFRFNEDALDSLMYLKSLSPVLGSLATMRCRPRLSFLTLMSSLSTVTRLRSATE